MTVVGGVAEISVLVLVVVELVKVQRREIPEHRGWVVRSLSAMRSAGSALAGEVRSLLGGAPVRTDATIHTHAARVSLSGSGSLSVTGTAGSRPSLPARVARLEAELRRLDERAAADREEMRTEARQAKAHTDAKTQEIRELIEERDRQRHAACAMRWRCNGSAPLRSSWAWV